MLSREEALEKIRAIHSDWKGKKVFLKGDEITEMGQIFTDTKLYRQKPGTGMAKTPGGIYIWGGAGYRDDENGKVEGWYTLYGHGAPNDIRAAAEMNCIQGWASLEARHWDGDFEGWSLILLRDGASIATPWLTIIETENWNEWIEEQNKQDHIELGLEYDRETRETYRRFGYGI
jgi:hypothetical protein